MTNELAEELAELSEEAAREASDDEEFFAELMIPRVLALLRRVLGDRWTRTRFDLEFAGIAPLPILEPIEGASVRPLVIYEAGRAALLNRQRYLAELAQAFDDQGFGDTATLVRDVGEVLAALTLPGAEGVIYGSET